MITEVQSTSPFHSLDMTVKPQPQPSNRRIQEDERVYCCARTTFNCLFNTGSVMFFTGCIIAGALIKNETASAILVPIGIVGEILVCGALFGGPQYFD